MANFTEFCDDGFQGRIFPHQRAKLREYFCLNPWPDTEFVYRIAAEIGVPVFVIFNYFEFVRSNKKRQPEVLSSNQPYSDSDDVLLLDPANKLEQHRLPPKPFFQSRELSTPQVEVDKSSDTTRKDEIDNILDEMLKSPKVKQDKNEVIDIHLSDVDEEIFPPIIRASSQDELMLALSEVGLSTGQMSKFCSDSDNFPNLEDFPQDFSKTSTYQSLAARNKPSQLVNKQRNYPDVWPNFEPDLELDSTNYDAPGPIFYSNSNTALTRGENNESSLSMAPYQINSYSPTQVMLSDNQNMFALSSVHCAALSSKGSDRQKNMQNFPSNTCSGELFGNFTEYEVVKGESNDLQPPLFHRYIKQKSPPKMLLPKATSTDVSNMNSDPILITSSSDEGLPTPGCSKPQQNYSSELSAQPLEILAMSPSPNKTKQVKRKRGPKPLGQEGPVVPKKRNMRCRTCGPCRAPDCGECMYCLDKPKFGGPNRRKNACVHRRCANMVPAHKRRSSKSALSSEKEVSSAPGMHNNVLDDIPVEIEGHIISGKDLVVGNHEITENRRLLNLRSTPVNCRVPTDGRFDKKNLNIETVNLDDDFEYLDNGNIEDAPSYTSANVEKHLYNQYLDAVAEGEDSQKYSKFDETAKKVRRNFYESEKGKVLLKEKIIAVNSDHSYAEVNRQCLDGMNSDIGVLAYEFEKEIDESVDIGDFYDENATEHQEEKGYLTAIPITEDYINNSNCVDEENEFDVFEDGIVPLEIVEESPEIASSNFSIGDDEVSGDESYEMLKDEGLPITLSGAKDAVNTEDVYQAMDGGNTEDQLTEEYYAKLDSSDRKEIEKQLTEDNEEPLHVFSDEANDSSPSSFNSRLVDANDHLLLECVEDVVVQPSCKADENASNLDELEEHSFQSVFENTIHGRSSRSSNLATVGMNDDKKEKDRVADNKNVCIDPM